MCEIEKCREECEYLIYKEPNWSIASGNFGWYCKKYWKYIPECSFNRNKIQKINNMNKSNCKYCNPGVKTIRLATGKRKSPYIDKEIEDYFNFGQGGLEMTIVKNILKIGYDAYSCDSSFDEELEINYCPFCGRNLKNK
jgi:hypothetical protein